MWLSEELERQEHRVEESEQAMAEYRAGHNAGSLGDRENIVTARLNQLNESATRARTARAQKESLYKQIEALGAAAAAETIPAIASNPSVQSVKATLADLQQQYPKLLMDRKGEIQPVDLGKKGVWHRLVFLPAGPRPEATKLCDQLMAEGYDRCWVKAY